MRPELSEKYDTDSGDEDSTNGKKTIGTNEEMSNSGGTASPNPGKLVDVERTRITDEEYRLRVENSSMGVMSVPKNWHDLGLHEQRDWFRRKVEEHSPCLPDSLITLIVGSTIDGDGRGSDCDAAVAAPDWLDREKFQRGQRFAMKHCAGVMLAELVSLFAVFSFGHALKPLIGTERSSKPFDAFRRYLSTVRRVRNWYSSDVWTEGTEGHQDVCTVRRMHANVRTRMNTSFRELEESAKIWNLWSIDEAMIREDFCDSCAVPGPGQCPYMFGAPTSTVDGATLRPNVLNQGEMASTQFGFMGLVVLYPRSFGVHDASDDDLEAFCHVWRGLGYLLGIEDEFNFCNGTLEEVRQRSRDFIDHWVRPNLREITPEWEHMTRCVIEGITYYIPHVTYEQCLLYFADTLEIPMPRVRSSISYGTWFRLNIMKFTLNWYTRFPRVLASFNRRFAMYVDAALEYDEKKLEKLRKKSEIAFGKNVTLSEDRAVALWAASGTQVVSPSAWSKRLVVVLSSAFIFLSLRYIIMTTRG